jgi:hypothetical protein
MIHRSATIMLAGVFLFSIAACGAPTPVSSSGGTADAQTLQAVQTQISGLAATYTAMPSQTPETPMAIPTETATEIPTVELLTSTPTTQHPTSSVPTPTTDSGLLATRTITGKCPNAFFVGDVGPVVDNYKIKAGTAFVKSWMIRNIGNCTWDRNYTLRFQYGYHLYGPSSVNFPQIIAPNQNLLLEVHLTAPSNPGTFEGQWYLFDAEGHRFGVGPDGNAPLTVKIIVVA